MIVSHVKLGHFTFWVRFFIFFLLTSLFSVVLTSAAALTTSKDTGFEVKTTK
ncbi:hypothetical protein BD408DRAFT_413028 [Parasitella parasitica]|nr:hypothetical protein BD408DRAFT_413028 [Parasitella parasitica]